MRKVWRLKFLTIISLAILFGGSAALSIAMMESVLAIGIACVVCGGVFLVAISKLGKKRK